MAEIRTTRDLFLWCIAVIYLFAFASLFIQLPGLYGENGILPVKNVLQQDAQSFADLLLVQPTLLRLLPRIGLDVAAGMDFLCVGGVILSFVAVVSRDQRNCVVFAALWAFYLSLFQVGQTFLWFQWDVLLLEVGFLSILVAPLNFFGFQDGQTAQQPHDQVTFWLVKWLLFRLTFASGVVKLTSNTETWWKLTEMGHHYETQFLPTPLAWYLHQFPDWLQKLSTVGVIVVQIAVPLLFFSPARNHRLLALYSQVFLFTMMTLTGNYNFYTLLTLTLCLSLVDDDWLSSWTEFTTKGSTNRDKWATSTGWVRRLKTLYTLSVYAALAFYTIRLFNLDVHTDPPRIESSTAFTSDDLTQFLRLVMPVTIAIGAAALAWELLSALYRSCCGSDLAHQKLANLVCSVVYGLLAVGMFSLSLVSHSAIEGTTQDKLPTELLETHAWTSKNYQLTSPYNFFKCTGIDVDGRTELILEGTDDPEAGWTEYNFRYKPGNLSEKLPVVAPHQPRLDWQMWFAARGSYEQNHWMLHLIYRLLTNQHEVLDLMGPNPFPDAPPKYIRAALYQYHFTSNDKTSDRYSDSAWWTREPLREYVPALSLDDESFITYLTSVGIYTDPSESEDDKKKVKVSLPRLTMESVRSLLGQGSGSIICLVLVVTGFVLSLLDPSMHVIGMESFSSSATYDGVCGK